MGACVPNISNCWQVVIEFKARIEPRAGGCYATQSQIKNPSSSIECYSYSYEVVISSDVSSKTYICMYVQLQCILTCNDLKLYNVKFKLNTINSVPLR